jgi:RHS repeat-associated protein
MIKTWYQLDTNAPVLLSMLEYNEVGQLATRRLYNTDPPSVADHTRSFKQSVRYKYNVRGWLQSINDPDIDDGSLLSMRFEYDQPKSGGAQPQYNGTISEIVWRTAGGDKQVYTMTYDKLYRLKAALYNNYSNASKAGRFDERIGSNTDAGYDRNGNILNLQRSGEVATAAYGIMDRLAYKYVGNQLIRVDDAIAPIDEKGGFRELTKRDHEYMYDKNGNMTIDSNKGIIAVEYNHLNLPRTIRRSATEYVVYTYDANGTKLSEEVFGPIHRKTEYMGDFVYTDGVLSFVNNEEGRIIPGAAPEYQYHLKDHLGNVRVTFTTKDGEETASATFERNNEQVESAQFENYFNVPTVNFNLFDHTHRRGVHINSSKSARISALTLNSTTIAKSLSVMPGDRISLEVFGKYVDLSDTTSNRALAESVFADVASGDNSFSGAVDGSSLTQGTAVVPLELLIKKGYDDSQKQHLPKAYLNFVLYDRDFNILDVGYKALSENAKESGANGDHERLAFEGDEIIAKEAGYMYTFLSNESVENIEVYFDDFSITSVHSSVVQQQDYYPFGLTFNAYKRENSLDNKFLFGGKERLDALNLDWIDYGNRKYSSDIARWHVVDPLSERGRRWSPYSYAFDNPVNFVDPDGMWPDLPTLTFKAISFVTGFFNSVVTNHHPTQAGRGMGRESADHISFDEGTAAGDKASTIVGVVEIYTGSTAAVNGVVAAPETLGLSLVVSAQGAALAAEGAVVLKNSMQNANGKLREKEVQDLKPLHSDETINKSQSQKDVEKLSDEKLLESANKPEDGQHITENKNTGKLINGNTRARELQKRANDPNNTNIQPDTKVLVEEYVPDNSMFDFNNFFDDSWTGF